MRHSKDRQAEERFRIKMLHRAEKEKERRAYREERRAKVWLRRVQAKARAKQFEEDKKIEFRGPTVLSGGDEVEH
jgi:hypothetical protein